LHILYGPVRIEDEMIRKAVADSARYDVYDLAEATLLGQFTRVYRVLGLLRTEGVAPAVVLWALARDLRLLASLLQLTSQGQSLEVAFTHLKERVFDKRKLSLSKAAERLRREDVQRALCLCARADRMIKGMAIGESWEALLDVCMSLAGKPPQVRPPIPGHPQRSA
jgi:DNA polymerase-3 subunit delta